MTKNFNSTNQYLVGAYTPPDGITVIGGKTGHTNTAGYNLVVLVQGQPSQGVCGCYSWCSNKRRTIQPDEYITVENSIIL